MSVAQRTGEVHDGQVYEKGEEIWDLGLWKHNPDGHYDYTGHESIAKLPPYVEAGSSAFDPVEKIAYVAYVDSSDPTKVTWQQL